MGQSIQLNANFFGNIWRGDHFIWCGVSNGSGGLTLTIADGDGNVLAQTTSYIQIKDIKQMYERWTVGEEPSRAPKSVADRAVDGVTTAFQYTPPQDTNTPYILFVHGWNMETWEKDRYAESSFKRLYWQGYQGRFGSFRWPTGNGITGTASAIIHHRNYDNSESNAWASATGLLNKLNDLDVEYPNNIFLMAHSMGNVVAGEALRLAGSNQVVNTYVAMQGAISAHCYDASTASRWSIGPPDRYAHYWTSNSPCYFNGIGGAGTFVNFFNTNDFALNLWTTDQDYKPDVGYQYSPSLDQFLRNVGLGSVSLYFPTNTYEIFAYADPSRSFALGAQANVGGIFQKLGVSQQINLQSVWPSDAHLNHDYSEHIWHSAQFRSDNPSRANFWKIVLGDNGFSLK